MNPKQPEDLHELCERLVEGQLTPDESMRLEKLVRDSASARRYVAEHLHLHAGLHWESGRIGQQTLPEQLAASLAGLDGSPEAGAVVALPSPWARRTPWLALAASIVFLAAGIGVGISLGKRTDPQTAGVSSAPVVATLTQTRGCRWESSALPTLEGARLTAGRLALTDGLATLRFESGATITLEAPAELEIVNKDLCVLHRGMLTARVPKEAVGFTVETANAKVIDHGTEFGISAGPNGQAHVQVFEGEVEVRHRRSGENLRLTTGENAVLNPKAVAMNGANAAEADRALRSEASSLPGSSITLTTASGRGRTAYVFSQGTMNHHSDSLMLVKNTHTPGYRRKAYFSFDLQSLKGRKVENAALALAFEPTGYGFASRLPTCVFTVYGLKDGSRDEWAEHELIWDNAPANLPGGNEIDTSQAVALGTFTIEPEESSGLRVISTPALAEFLNDDSNGQATLMVVRETSETVLKGLASGLVHGFAGNYHPTAPPPTLRLNLQEAR